MSNDATNPQSQPQPHRIIPPQPHFQGQYIPAPKPKKRFGLWIGIAVTGAILGVFALCMGAFVAIGNDKPKVTHQPGSVTATGEAAANKQAPSPTKPAAKTFAAGEAGKLTGVDGLEATISVGAGKMVNGDYSGRFLVASVEIAVQTGTMSYDPYSFKLKGTDGVEYNSGYSGAKDALKSGTLPAGQKVKGSISFEVPDAALVGAVVEYIPGFDGAIGYWKVG